MPSDEHYKALAQVLKAYDDLGVAYHYLPLQTIRQAQHIVLAAYLTMRELPEATYIVDDDEQQELEIGPF